MKHPWNKEIGNGSISEQLGWGCAVAMAFDGTKEVIFYEGQHGMCELHEPKK